MNVIGNSTDVTTYFALRLAATGAEATGLTISDIDLQYTRSGVAPVAKVDAVALAATDTAHTDNRGIEIDATDQPGLYRVDWPDAAFAAGVKEVILSVKCALCFTEHLRVSIDAPVIVSALNAAGLATLFTVDSTKTSADAINGSPVKEIIDLITSTFGAGPYTADTGSVLLDLTQAIPTTNTAQTLGDCLSAARAQGFGKWVKSGTTLTLYAGDGTTVVRTFTLDDADAPTERT